jgi:CubicO group peptidase (beta-lactamase class C family)
MSARCRPVLITCLLLGFHSIAGAATEEVLNDITSFLAETYPADRPGASVLIMERGEIVHQAGYGLANVELGVPITKETVFRIGSVTKQFTATGIMLLEQRGQLSTSDPIKKYLPDYPTHGHNITIDHLLRHTSGIKSYTGIPDYMNTGIRDDLTTDELIDVFDNLPMEFAPGDQWNYNNSGYVLLGAIIEVVSGTRYEDFIAEQIAGPLGLTSTVYGGPKLVPNRASGYELDDDGNVVNAGFLSMTQPHAAGALLSTTGDLLAWHNALTGGEFIHDSSYIKMTSPSELNDGQRYPYGYGLSLGTLRGHRSIAHGGGIHGFACYTLWLPDEDVYIAILTNGAAEGPGPTTVASLVTAMYIGDPYPERKATDLSEADLNGLTGRFQAEHFPAVEIRIEAGQLIMEVGEFSVAPLFAESRYVLFMQDTLEYLDVQWGGLLATELHLHETEGEPPVVLKRVTN